MGGWHQGPVTERCPLCPAASGTWAPAHQELEVSAPHSHSPKIAEWSGDPSSANWVALSQKFLLLALWEEI